jgi:hypothetical protein
MPTEGTVQAGIETLWSAEEVERFIRPPGLAETFILLERRLLKLYKSVLVTPVALIAQAIFHSQAHCRPGLRCRFAADRKRFFCLAALTILLK